MADDLVYNAIWQDLPAFSESSTNCAKWMREWSWANLKARYSRSTAFPLEVTAEQHERLKAALRSASAVSAEALSYCLAAWPDGYVAADKSKDYIKKNGYALWMPEGFVQKFMGDLTLRLRKMGVAYGSMEWNAVERAASGAMGECLERVKRGQPPRLGWIGDLPGGMSVRLGCGLRYGPLCGWPGEGWLDLPDLGRTRMPDGFPEAFAAPSAWEYVEVAHIRQTWHCRAIVCEPRSAEEMAEAEDAKAAKRAEGTAKKSGAPVVKSAPVAKSGAPVAAASAPKAVAAPRVRTAGERLALDHFIERENGDAARAEADLLDMISDMKVIWDEGPVSDYDRAMAHNAKLAAAGRPEIALHRLRDALRYTSTSNLDATFPVAPAEELSPAWAQLIAAPVPGR